MLVIGFGLVHRPPQQTHPDRVAGAGFHHPEVHHVIGVERLRRRLAAGCFDFLFPLGDFTSAVEFGRRRPRLDGRDGAEVASPRFAELRQRVAVEVRITAQVEHQRVPVVECVVQPVGDVVLVAGELAAGAEHHQRPCLEECRHDATILADLVVLLELLSVGVTVLPVCRVAAAATSDPRVRRLQAGLEGVGLCLRPCTGELSGRPERGS